VPSRALIDAGPIIALFDKDDRFYEPVKSFIAVNRFPFVSTLAVVTETTHMLDFSIEAQTGFLEWVWSGGVTIQEIRRDDFSRIIALMRKYADLPMDFADATLVVAAEKTRIRTILSLDSDFDVYRLPGKGKIENVFPTHQFR